MGTNGSITFEYACLYGNGTHKTWCVKVLARIVSVTFEHVGLALTYYLLVLSVGFCAIPIAARFGMLRSLRVRLAWKRHEVDECCVQYHSGY